jgi:hypothetical protein
MRATRRCRPAVEALEGRTLPSAGPGFAVRAPAVLAPPRPPPPAAPSPPPAPVRRRHPAAAGAERRPHLHPGDRAQPPRRQQHRVADRRRGGGAGGERLREWGVAHAGLRHGRRGRGGPHTHRRQREPDAPGYGPLPGRVRAPVGAFPVHDQRGDGRVRGRLGQRHGYRPGSGRAGRHADHDLLAPSAVNSLLFSANPAGPRPPSPGRPPPGRGLRFPRIRPTSAVCRGASSAGSPRQGRACGRPPGALSRFGDGGRMTASCLTPGRYPDPGRAVVCQLA